MDSKHDRVTLKSLAAAGAALFLAGCMFCADAALARSDRTEFSIGERHLITTDRTAALRDAQHRDQIRITVWYPAVSGSVEKPLDIGPPGHPLFKPGSAALDAPFADNKRRPIILFSHGFGGTARIMAWFGTALARQGYVVVAPDHPGNNSMDQMTVAGALLFWERPHDLAAALKEVESDPTISAHIDPFRLGVAGFSAGGFTALAAAGGRVDLKRYSAFCVAHPADGDCQPQKEFPITREQAEAFIDSPAMALERKRSHGDLSIPGVKAVFVMAPAIVQSFTPTSLAHIDVPVSIILGDADPVAPPAANGEVAAELIPGAKIKILRGVGHYDFLAECTPAGTAAIPFCPTTVPRARTHREAIKDALSLFDRTIGRP